MEVIQKSLSMKMTSVNHPVSLYAATKRTNELMAHTYSHLYGIPTTGLRLFTVYGPWGRPDMAPMLFANGIISRKKIRINNNGDMSRDFTYIDDVIEIIFRLLFKPATPFDNFDKNKPKASLSWAPHRFLILVTVNLLISWILLRHLKMN